ncbi:thermonuclease family protein [Candidatus Hydrogenedentota bacterium]
MNYEIRIRDEWGRRCSVLRDVPLLEISTGFVTENSYVRGLLASKDLRVGHNYVLEVYLDGRRECEVEVKTVTPTYGDSKKLILDKYIDFSSMVSVSGEMDWDELNGLVGQAYTNMTVSEIAKDVITLAPSDLHYYVAHDVYPDGAERESAKFLARRPGLSEFPVGSIASGEYVSGARINFSGAYAKDGDTIAGLVVDGVAWPDVRLMMIDAEETSLNSHALKLHPEVATWSDAKYNKSGYKFRADKSTAALQDLLDTNGIDYIELNWHVDALGDYDDRVDSYGRYVGLIYGGDECFNAAMVELGHSDPYLYESGRYHPREMRLKEYFSYSDVHVDSIEASGTVVSSLDAMNGMYEVLTTLAYMEDGWVWRVDVNHGVSMGPAARIDRVVRYDPRKHGLSLETRGTEVRNQVWFLGNPVSGQISKTYSNQESIDMLGTAPAQLQLFSLSLEEDADLLLSGLLEDVAYPGPSGHVRFIEGDTASQVGDLLEIRGEAIERTTPEISGEWGSRFAGRNVFAIKRKRVFLRGKRTETYYYLTSPVRSVDAPLSYIVRGQPREDEFFQFRLDDAAVGLDMGFHLD